MGQSQIEAKLAEELKRDIANEMQVVYILSRVRKLLEISKSESQYPILNFYCNWALHSGMTRTDGKEINAMLRKFIEEPQGKIELGFHTQFVDQLKKFLNNENLPVPTVENLRQFRFQLQKIIADTPIEVRAGIKYKIEFKEPLNADESGLHVTTVVE